jgi:hypothetical protein
MSLEVNIGYYDIEFSSFSKQSYTIVIPFGKYEYQQLPMGLCNSPDTFQETISKLMLVLNYIQPTTWMIY